MSNRDARRSLLTFFGALIGSGAAWFTAEIAMSGYTDLPHVVVDLVVSRGVARRIAIAATVRRSQPA